MNEEKIIKIFVYLGIGFIVGLLFAYGYYESKYDIKSANNYCEQLGYERFGDVIVIGNPDGSIAELRATCIKDDVRTII